MDIEKFYIEYFESLKSVNPVNERKLSIMSIIVDCQSLATILDYYNEHTNANENLQARTLIIRNFAYVVYEIYKYGIDAEIWKKEDFEKYKNDIERVQSLRNKLHQFQYRSFTKKARCISNNMGRSVNYVKPHLDLSILIDDEQNLRGINMHQFHMEELKQQNMVNFMQNAIRTVVNSVESYSKIKIKGVKPKKKFTWYSYSYVDVMKNCKTKDVRVIDRLLIIFDDLSMITMFFSELIDTNDYIRSSPSLVYFFCKVIAIVLDETFDNINSLIKNTKTSDAELFQDLVYGINNEFQTTCKLLRNNIHYEEQTCIPLNYADMYEVYTEELLVAHQIEKKVVKLLNINPSKFRLTIYKVLAWIQK